MIRTVAFSHPIAAAFGLLAACFVLRLADLLVFRLDEKLGEIILSKSLGLVAVLAYAIAACGTVPGLRLEGAGLAVRIGAVSMGALFVVAYGTQLVLLGFRGQSPSLVLTAIDPKTARAGATLFALLMIAGNVINALMEEGLFRGILLGVFRARLSFWSANLAQASLFALWHVVWPAKHLWTGEATMYSAGNEAASLLGATFVSGLTFGYMYHATNSLWTPIVAHFVNNSVYNFVHIRTTAGLDAEFFTVQVIATVGLLPLMLLARLLAKQ